MKPFDLEAAKRGEPIQTRDGQLVKFIAHVPEADESQRLVILIDNTVVGFYKKGTHARDLETELDLFMAPRKRTVWVNLYRPYADDYSYGQPATCFATKELADGSTSVNKRVGNRAWPLELNDD